jgi:hypothetical protein
MSTPKKSEEEEEDLFIDAFQQIIIKRQVKW